MAHCKWFILLYLAFFAKQIALAYDFEVNSIYYNIISKEDKTVEVTYKDNSETATPSYKGIITIPTSVTFNKTDYSVIAIGDWAFCRCTELTDIVLPNSIERIGCYSFFNCSSLVAFPIPESVSIIGNRAFYGNSCFSTTSNIRYIDNYLVSAIDKTLNTYTIEEGTKWIGSKAFSGCNNMTNIQIPNTVVFIANRAFSGCSNLSSINIPANVEKIGYYVFEGCSSLTDITVENATPPTIEGSTFIGVNKDNCVLHVPYGSKTLFQEASEWKEFTIMESGLGDINIDNAIDEIDYKTIADRILNRAVPINFNEKSADANQDGIISVSDISEIIDRQKPSK